MLYRYIRLASSGIVAGDSRITWLTYTLEQPDKAGGGGGGDPVYHCLSSAGR